MSDKSLGQVLFDQLVERGIVQWIPRWGWTEFRQKDDIEAAAEAVVAEYERRADELEALLEVE